RASVRGAAAGGRRLWCEVHAPVWAAVAPPGPLSRVADGARARLAARSSRVGSAGLASRLGPRPDISPIVPQPTCADDADFVGALRLIASAPRSTPRGAPRRSGGPRRDTPPRP